MKNFSKSSVFLFPSKIDSFGMSILEASYCGIPTIAFDINSAKELIENDKNGFLVKNSLEFSQKALDVLTYYKLCEVVLKNCEEKVMAYSSQEFYKRLSKVF
jgi:glycosyltransferase involved in cell wall biosynthesis